MLFTEWLDVGLSRKAIQECDKVLKKQPGLQCARVLKGLALLRSGKSDEAEHSIQQVLIINTLSFRGYRLGKLLSQIHGRETRVHQGAL